MTPQQRITKLETTIQTLLGEIDRHICTIADKDQIIVDRDRSAKILKERVLTYMGNKDEEDIRFNRVLQASIQTAILSAQQVNRG